MIKERGDFFQRYTLETFDAVAKPVNQGKSAFLAGVIGDFKTELFGLLKNPLDFPNHRGAPSMRRASSARRWRSDLPAIHVLKASGCSTAKANSFLGW